MKFSTDPRVGGQGSSPRRGRAALGPADQRDRVAGYYLLAEPTFQQLTGKHTAWYVYVSAEEGADPVAVRDSVAESIQDIANTQAMTMDTFTQYQD